MERVAKILIENKKKYPDFEYYNLHLSKIQKNVIENPDIAIETCKSLIEGVSKSILNRLDVTFDEKTATSGRNPKSVQQLFKLALEKVAEQNENFESGFVHSSGQIINITSNIRTERGDISHGKSVPKTNNSTSEFSSMVSKMTDLVISYVLKHFFEIDLGYKEKLNYEDREMEAYNYWLDDNTYFPIKKAKYSQLLFENDYDEYEIRYSDEFLKLGEDEEETEHKDKTVEVEINTIEEEIAEMSTTKKEFEKPSKPPSKIGGFFNFDSGMKEKKEPVDLVNTFNATTFWTEEANKQLELFAESINLKAEKLKNLINNYLFTEKRSIRDEVVAAMNKKPTLVERRTIIEPLIDKIIKFANDLKKSMGKL